MTESVKLVAKVVKIVVLAVDFGRKDDLEIP